MSEISLAEFPSHLKYIFSIISGEENQERIKLTVSDTEGAAVDVFVARLEPMEQRAKSSSDLHSKKIRIVIGEEGNRCLHEVVTHVTQMST